MTTLTLDAGAEAFWLEPDPIPSLVILASEERAQDVRAWMQQQRAAARLELATAAVIHRHTIATARPTIGDRIDRWVGLPPENRQPRLPVKRRPWWRRLYDWTQQ